MRKIRTRLINFRVTDEEFELLKTASDRLGARCLSDFARSSMLNQSKCPPASESVNDRMNTFDRRLTVLERSMARLVDAISGAPVHAASEN